MGPHQDGRVHTELRGGKTKTPSGGKGLSEHIKTGVAAKAGLRAARACVPVCEPGERPQLSGEPSSQMAFRNKCVISFRGTDLRAASSSSARGGLAPHCCRGR